MSTRHTFALMVVAAIALAAGACSRGHQADQPYSAPVVTIGRESVTTVSRQPISTGPLLSGELRPEREATVRAQVGGSLLDVRVDQGQPVREGAVLARIEAAAIRDAQASAQSGVQSAEQALQMATREAQRTEMLVKGGALAERDLEVARNAVTAAQAQLAEARARLAAATTQLNYTFIRAPITGIVSNRAVNTGDVVTNGTALFTVIDPSSMRLDASVPSDALAALRVGAPVHFQVRGYPDQTFDGRIARISPIADPATRLVPIFVTIPNTKGRLVAGLFAEGRVTSETRTALVVPSTAVDVTGAKPWVLRVRNGKTERVDVDLGVRDERNERVEVTSGVSEGDVLLMGAAQTVTPGTPVRIEGPRSAGPARQEHSPIAQ
jgi:membrane fusion protein (multidrug efflux system)